MKPPTTQATLIQEAATWMMRLSDEAASEADWDAWRLWTSQSDEHRKFARMAESLAEKLRDIPSDVGRTALNAPRAAARRTALKTLAFLLVAAPASYVATRLPWQEWNADYRTGTGEQRVVMLPDGGRMTLDTASAVNVAYDDRGRTVELLAGRIFIATAADKAVLARPFRVGTNQGQVRAIGTRFEVRRGAVEDRVAVFDGAVEITPAGATAQPRTLPAGWRTGFSRELVQAPQALSPGDALWLQKRVQVENIPLGQLIDELARYRRGVLRCDPDVAALPISGTYSLDDTDLALQLLADALPVRITRRTGYWVTVGPR